MNNNDLGSNFCRLYTSDIYTIWIPYIRASLVIYSYYENMTHNNFEILSLRVAQNTLSMLSNMYKDDIDYLAISCFINSSDIVDIISNYLMDGDIETLTNEFDNLSSQLDTNSKIQTFLYYIKNKIGEI